MAGQFQVAGLGSPLQIGDGGCRPLGEMVEQGTHQGEGRQGTDFPLAGEHRSRLATAKPGGIPTVGAELGDCGARPRRANR
jgi:hypothetical protein